MSSRLNWSEAHDTWPTTELSNALSNALANSDRAESGHMKYCQMCQINHFWRFLNNEGD